MNARTFLGTLAVLVLAPRALFAQADKIFEQNSPAVVTVFSDPDANGGYRSLGSGSILRADGVIVTNFHVIQGGSTYEVRIGKHPGTRRKATLLYSDPSKDYALLKAEAPEALPTVKLGDPDKLREGQRVYLIGSPQGLENTISDGLVSAIREPYVVRYRNANFTVDLKKAIQISAPMSPGSSGGAAFNEQGEIVAITTFQNTVGQNLNFAVPIDVVHTIDGRVVPLDEALRRHGVKRPEEVLCLRASRFRGEKRLKEAAESYLKALELNKECVDAQVGLGATFYEMGVYKKAVEALRTATAFAPDEFMGFHYLGLTYKELEDYDRAVEALEKSAAFAFKESDLPLKEVFQAAKKHEAQIESLKATIASTPDSAEAHFKLGRLYKILLEDEEAIRSLKKAVEADPKLFEAHKLLGDLYFRTGKHAEALGEYKEALRLREESVEVHFNMAQVFLARFALTEEARDRAGFEREAQVVRKLSKNLGKYLVLPERQRVEFCFLPGVGVLMEDGSEVPIERVKPGDRLVAFTAEGTITSSTVRAAMTARTEQYYEIETRTTSVRVTPGHPFWAGGSTFRRAEDLLEGDAIYLRNGDRLSTEVILRKTTFDAPSVVYNLHTDSPHTFFANRMAVHNK